MIASASTDNLARIWQAKGFLVASTTSSTCRNSLTDVSFSADSDLVVTASKDGTARVSKSDGGALLVTLFGHSDSVTSAEFAGGVNSAVLTASSDGTARVWDATFQPQLRELARLGTQVEDVRFVGQRRIRAVTVDGRAHILDARTGVELRVGRASRRSLRAVASDGTTATIHGNTVVLRRPKGRVMVLRKHRDRIFSVAFSPDGSLLATASKDHDVRIWDVATGESLLRLQHNSKVRDAQFSPDGRWLVTAAGRAGLYDTRDGTPILRLQGHEGPVAAAAFDRTGKWIVTGGHDGTIRTYRCQVCDGIDDLVTLARARLAITGREFSPRERTRYLG